MIKFIPMHCGPRRLSAIFSNPPSIPMLPRIDAALAVGFVPME